MKKKIYCQPTDCENCPYPDCIGEIKPKGKPGRKPLPPEEKKKRKSAYMKKYFQKNKERLNRINLENYYKRKQCKQREQNES